MRLSLPKLHSAAGHDYRCGSVPSTCTRWDQPCSDVSDLWSCIFALKCLLLALRDLPLCTPYGRWTA